MKRQNGVIVPIGLNSPPRFEIEPESFYQNRKRYRNELVSLVNSELCSWRIKRLDQAEAS